MMNLKNVLCFECDNKANEIHHVIPIIMGGRRGVPLCSECHGKIHNMSNRKGHGNLTKLGLEKAKSLGVVLGSPRKFSDIVVSRVISLRKKKLTVREVSKLTGMSPSRISQIDRKYKNSK